jgi:uncharacterized protein
VSITAKKAGLSLDLIPAEALGCCSSSAASGSAEADGERIPLERFFERIAVITMKLTLGCNLKCTYCNTETASPQTPKMSLDLWKQVARLLIENSREQHVSIEFHGGEPLLLGDDFLLEAARYAFELGRKNGKRVQVPMVTNGTLLTAERIQRLKDVGVAICLSCDGPPEINDRMRGSGHAVFRAIRLLQEADYLRGVMTVMSTGNWDRMTEVMGWYADIGVRWFSINFQQPQGRGIDDVLLTDEQLLEGTRQVFEHMAHHRVAVFEQKLGQQIERFVEGRVLGGQGCWEFECQAGRSYVAIDLHGRIHACGSDVSHHVLGQIQDGYIDRANYEDKLKRLHHKGDWVLRCFDCNARRICDHSCPTSDFNNLAYKEAECLATKKLWNYFCANKDRVREVYRIATRRGFIKSKPYWLIPSLMRI